MALQPLTGKKIAVLVESQYIPGEIRLYQERFASYGATVHLMSRLWGQPQLTFVSEVEEMGQIPETLIVTIDFEQISLDDYAAVIMAANFTSVRLRWNDACATSGNPAEAARDVPAVRFFRRAMENSRIVKGAPCHALWLLTPVPEVLANRRVTCNPVMLADVINTGAIYVPAPAGSDWHQHVVVDDDLVTSMSAGGTQAFINVIKNQIVARGVRPAAPPTTARNCSTPVTQYVTA